MELTKLQKDIIESNSPKIAVEACAAALKTSTLTEKVRKLLRDGINPQTVAVITFTRMAAAELIGRLGEDYKDGIFVGTIHALAAKNTLLIIDLRLATYHSERLHRASCRAGSTAVALATALQLAPHARMASGINIFCSTFASKNCFQ